MRLQFGKTHQLVRTNPQLDFKHTEQGMVSNTRMITFRNGNT
jgi:hypothetical protein